MSNSGLGTLELPPPVALFLARHCNLHRVLLALTLALFFIAWNRGLALLYGLFSFLLALLLLSYGLPLLQLRQLRVGLRAQGEFRVGQNATIECQLWAPSPRHHLSVRVALPFAEGGVTNAFFAEAHTASIQRLNLACELRGCFTLREVEVESRYPFGIFTYRRKIAITPLEVLVLPAIVLLSCSPQGQVGDDNSLGALLTHRTGGQGEFASIRDYRAGDELRHIHWTASARAGALVVKEYEHRNHAQLLVVVNTRPEFNVGEGNNASFELAIRLVGALVARATQEGIPSYLAADDNWQLAVPAYAGDLYPVYELLARLRCEGRRPYTDSVGEACLRHPHAHMLVTLRTEHEPIPSPISTRCTHVDLLLDSKSFRFPAQIEPTNRGLRDGQRLTYRLRANTQLEDLFQ